MVIPSPAADARNALSVGLVIEMAGPAIRVTVTDAFAGRPRTSRPVMVIVFSPVRRSTGIVKVPDVSDHFVTDGVVDAALIVEGSMFCHIPLMSICAAPVVNDVGGEVIAIDG